MSDAGLINAPVNRWRLSWSQLPSLRTRPKLMLLLLTGLCLVTGCIALTLGPVSLTPARVLQILLFGWQENAQFSVQERVVVLDLRLPRILLAMLVGAGLAVTGAVFQGLFRNPLADPGLIGVSSGAACGAVLVIVLGAQLAPQFMLMANQYAVPLGAFFGSLVATFAVYTIASARGNTDTALLLLAGIAISALCMAVTGICIYVADDNQLRTLTFWTMGSLAGVHWQELLLVGGIMAAALTILLRMGRTLDALAMGEAVAQHLGLPVERIKRRIVLLTALLVGCAVSVSGLIGFVGLVVPHLVRLALGPQHRWLLPLSALGGALLLLVADTVARNLVAPAEVPIGLITALIGAPFFIWLLLSRKLTKPSL